MKLHTAAAVVGLSIGFFIGAPYTLGVLGLALPCFLLWVVIVEGPDREARKAAEWRGDWRQLLMAQNNIRRGPRA